jgi:hypothetical protein
MFNQREGGDPMSYEITALEEGLGYEVFVLEAALG